MVTMATSFTVSANSEVEFVRGVARRRGFNESCDENIPFGVYSPNPPVCLARRHLETLAKESSISQYAR